LRDDEETTAPEATTRAVLIDSRKEEKPDA
jgi:hypothetical protein